MDWLHHARYLYGYIHSLVYLKFTWIWAYCATAGTLTKEAIFDFLLFMLIGKLYKYQVFGLCLTQVYTPHWNIQAQKVSRRYNQLFTNSYPLLFNSIDSPWYQLLFWTTTENWDTIYLTLHYHIFWQRSWSTKPKNVLFDFF